MRTLIFRETIDFRTGKRTTHRILVELNHIDDLPAAMAEIDRRYPRFGEGRRDD